jgi:predicted ester cyclase
MSPDEARDLLAKYVHAVWAEADPEAARRFLAPGFVRHMSPTGPSLDLEQQMVRLHAFRRAMPDAAVTVEGVAVEGDLIVFRSTLRGTHWGPLLGIPGTGRSVTVRLVDMIRIEDGLFAEQWGGPDMLDLVLQLGATISPPG